MTILIKRPADVPASEITPLDLFRRRRAFIKAAGTIGGAAALGASAGWPLAAQAADRVRLFGVKKSPLSIDEKQTPYDVVTTYNKIVHNALL